MTPNTTPSDNILLYVEQKQERLILLEKFVRKLRDRIGAMPDDRSVTRLDADLMDELKEILK